MGQSQDGTADNDGFEGDGRDLGFVAIQNVVIDEYAKRIGVYGLAVYAVIVRHAREGVAWPSHKRIADMLSISQPTVAKAVAVLVEAGLIQTARRTRPDGGNSSLSYYLKQPKAVRKTRTTAKNPSKDCASTPPNKVARNKTNLEQRTPLPPRRGDRKSLGRRKRSPLNPITLPEMRNWKSLMRWVCLDDRIDRDPLTGVVDRIQGAALGSKTPEVFLEVVASGLSGDWSTVPRVSQAEFIQRTASMKGKC